jgi:hypothetical protein
MTLIATLWSPRNVDRAQRSTDGLQQETKAINGSLHTLHNQESHFWSLLSSKCLRAVIIINEIRAVIRLHWYLKLKHKNYSSTRFWVRSHSQRKKVLKTMSCTPTACLHVSARLALDGYPLRLVPGDLCREDQNLVKTGKRHQALQMKT